MKTLYFDKRAILRKTKNGFYLQKLISFYQMLGMKRRQFSWTRSDTLYFLGLALGLFSIIENIALPGGPCCYR